MRLIDAAWARVAFTLTMKSAHVGRYDSADQWAETFWEHATGTSKSTQFALAERRRRGLS